MRVGGEALDTALYHRDSIGATIAGPAIVLEDTCTTVVSPGWTARPVSGGHLLLERR